MLARIARSFSCYTSPVFRCGTGNGQRRDRTRIPVVPYQGSGLRQILPAAEIIACKRIASP